MNYYEHHLGDYLRDTAHLSMLEDGAYRRLLDAYYIRERPLPKAVKDVCRLVRAASKPERDAVQSVLMEFFTSTAAGWQHARCDAELQKFREKAPDREARRENERQRQRRARERRKEMFNLLRQHGVVPAYDATMEELQSLCKNLGLADLQDHDRRDVTALVTLVTGETTGSHTPVSNPQAPGINHQALETAHDAHADSRLACESTAVEVCMALKKAGLASVNPGHPGLRALLERGATVANFVAAASLALEKKNPFAYVIGTVEGQLRDAAAISAAPRATIKTMWRSKSDQNAATFAALTGSIGQKVADALRQSSDEVSIGGEWQNVQ